MKHITFLSDVASRFRRRSSAEAGIRLFHLDHLRTRPRYRNEAIVRQLCANAYLGNGRSLCRVLGRYKMIVDTTDVGLSSHLLLDGYWEMWTTEAMLRFIRPGMTAIDIGANLGYFTMLMADLVGSGGRVVAFEPNPRMAERARRSAHVNGFAPFTQIHEVALSDEPGDTVMFVPPTEPKNAHFSQPSGRDGEIRVRVQRADAFEALLDADFIKIDTEGAEDLVWRGMTGLLHRNRPLTVFMEFTPVRYADAPAFLDAILAAGFALHRIDYFDPQVVVPTTREAVLSAPAHEDQMLVLTR